MTGPEHYREAERLLTQAAGVTSAAAKRGDSLVTAQTAHTMLSAEAQAHATLALAAAQVETAYAVATRGGDGGIRQDWVEATA